jgi:RNA polymerase sigma-70 factor (ECF subfamily)
MRICQYRQVFFVIIIIKNAGLEIKYKSLHYYRFYQQTNLIIRYIYVRRCYMKEEECIRELAKGNIQALEQIYNLMKTTVYAVALAIVRNKSMAEDIMQETFVKVYMKIDKYIPDTNPRAWVISIARNLAYDLLRSRKTIVFSDDFGEGCITKEAEEAGVSVDESLLNRMELTGELLKLGEIERQIVVLHAVGGLKHSEISKILKIPEGTVRWKYSSTLKKLAERLGGCEDGAGKISGNCIGFNKRIPQ